MFYSFQIKDPFNPTKDLGTITTNPSNNSIQFTYYPNSWCKKHHFLHLRSVALKLWAGAAQNKQSPI